MRELILYICILAWITPAASQESQFDSPHDLLLKLKRSNEDTSKVNLFLKLSEYYFSKSKRQANDLDSSLLYAHSAEALSNELAYKRGIGNSYEQISKVLHVHNDTTKAKYYANKAIEIFKTNNYFIELGYAYFDLSGYYSLYAGELYERIRIVEQLAVPAFRKSGNKRKEADILKELGDLQQLNGNYSGALSSLKKALQIYQSIGYLHLQGTYDLLGRISSMVGNDDQALKYGLLAIQSAELVKDTTLQLATIYNRLGSTYHRMNKYQLAYQCFQKSLSIAEKYGDTETILIIIYNTGKLLIDMNKPEESLQMLQTVTRKYPTTELYLKMYIASNYLVTYQNLKRYKEAQKFCDELLKLSEKLPPNDPDQIVVQYPVTEFYLETRQYALARRHLARTDTFFKANQSPLKLSKNHLLWFKLDSIEGKYLSAISHYQQYKSLMDSSVNEKTKKNIEQLQIEFETEKKDQNIKLLENESKLQHGKLIQANQTRNWIIGVAMLFLIIIGLLINFSRLKQRTNKKLKVQQTEISNTNFALQHLVEEKEWLVKEIHHRVKNNFHIVMGLLGTQSKYLKSEEAINAMAESRYRVHAMSLIHQKLYQSDNLSAINMTDYIYELVNYLRDSFNIGQSIQFNLQIDPVELDLAHCIPLGLIMNEAITNSIKYAFPDNKEGIIFISFKHTSKGHLLLAIRDNGVGLPAGFNTQGLTSMGMKLMHGLSEDIDGEFTITNHDGTEIMLDFIYEPELPIGIPKTNTEITNSI